MTQTVLIVDDDPDLRETVRRILERDGLAVSEAQDGAGMMRELGGGRPDLLLLDLMLHNENGLELAQKVRATSDMPMIILSGKDDVIDRIVGLELGADDYITKPFHARELSARVRSVLRRSGTTAHAEAKQPATSEQKQFGAWSFTPDTGQLIRRDGTGEEVILTGLETRVLDALSQSPRRVLTRDQIMDMCGERDWSPFDRSIDVVIGKLRKKLKDDPQTPRYIRTVRGIGYSFIGNIGT